MSMFNPDEVRRSTRTIMGIRTVPPDARVGQVLTVLPDRTFGWATAPVNTGPKGDTGAQGPQGVPGLLAIDYRDGIAVPAITSLLGISNFVDVTVTWNTPFTDTSYSIVKPQVSAASASLIGKTDAVVKSKTTAGCVVTVTSTAVLATGACTLGVLAFKKG